MFRASLSHVRFTNAGRPRSLVSARPDWPQGRCTRLSFIRSPVHLDALSGTLESSPHMTTLELIDVGMFLAEDDLLFSLLAQYASKVRFLAVKLEGGPEPPGLLDKVFEVGRSVSHFLNPKLTNRPTRQACPVLETLHIYHDLITPRFFDQAIPPDLRVLLIGTSRGAPLVFRGRPALESLWAAARAHWAECGGQAAGVVAQVPVVSEVASEVDVEDGTGTDALQDESEGRPRMNAFERWLETGVRAGADRVESLDLEASLEEASRLCVSAFQ